MNPSLCFLTAAWLAGQGGDVPRPMPQPATVQQPTRAPAAQPAPAQGWRWGGERRGLLSKIGQKISGLFSRGRAGDAQAPDAQAVPQGQPAPTEAGRVNLPRPAIPPAQPAPGPGAGRAASDGGVAQAAQAAHAGQAAQATKDGTAAVKPKYVEKIGNETDYSWVTGQLFRVHAGRAPVWVVRYATVDTIDKHGGSVVLSGAVDLKTFREGDLVSVRGEILNDGRPGRQLGGAMYRVSRIDLIERAE